MKKVFSREDLLENYRKTFFDFDQLKISLVKTSYEIDIEAITTGKGVPLILLPPMGCLATAWRYQFQAFAKHYEVCALHYPGTGQSGFNHNIKDTYDIQKVLLEVINNLYPNVHIHIVGWSLGGRIAISFLDEIPEKIKTVTLVNSANIKSVPSKKRGLDLVFNLAENFNVSKSNSKNIESIEPKQINGIFTNEVRAFYYSKSSLFDQSSILRVSTQPILVVAGSLDTIIPISLSKSFWKSLDNVELHILKKGGHYIPLFNPEYFNKRMHDFLTKHPR